jgi:alpha-D-ribose 1-methylphosphonate 5-triphosphate synthase subunit PhnH
VNLGAVTPGFADPPGSAQAAFRGALAAASRPGAILLLDQATDPPPGVQPAAMALLLALLDPDTRLWLSPSAAAGDGAASLHFHTGCPVVPDPAEADFALIGAPEELPPLEHFKAGTEDYPDRSGTLVLQVPALAAAGAWRLAGPGIRGEAALGVAGLGADFVAAWARNGARFPRGVDLFLVCGARLCALPRTVHILS